VQATRRTMATQKGGVLVEGRDVGYEERDQADTDEDGDELEGGRARA